MARHSPVILKYPGMPPAAVHEELLSSVDIMPTLLDLLAVKYPEGLDGRSWVSLLNGEKQDGRDFIVGHPCEHGEQRRKLPTALHPREGLGPPVPIVAGWHGEVSGRSLMSWHYFQSHGRSRCHQSDERIAARGEAQLRASPNR